MQSFSFQFYLLFRINAFESAMYVKIWGIWYIEVMNSQLMLSCVIMPKKQFPTSITDWASNRMNPNSEINIIIVDT